MGQKIFGGSEERTFRLPLETLLLGFFGLSVMFYSYNARYSDLWERASAFLWVGLIPATRFETELPSRYFLRVLLVMTGAFQLLHAYPVAGSQIMWSLVWLVPLGMVCLYDAYSALPLPALSHQPSLLAARKVVASVLVVAALGAAFQRTWTAREEYRSLEALNLPGALRLRTDWLSARIYRWLTNNLSAHADTFVSIPGLDSLYLWTGKEPPNRFSGSFWMAILPDEDQNATIRDLSRFPNAAAIRHKGLVDFWTMGQEDSSHDRPLVAYIDQNFQTIGRIGDYEFMVRRGRKPFDLKIEPLLALPIMQLPGIFVRNEPKLAIIDGASALLSSSDNEIRFEWSTEARTLTVGYGLYPEICDEADGTPVQLMIEKRTPRSTILLFEQTLDPETAKDRGTHRLEISVPSYDNGTLSLTTRAIQSPPVDNCFYWTDLEVR